jgi:hypothetical protein
MFDQHKRHDLSKRVRDTLTSATAACKNQDNAIAAHLASLSLSSDHSKSANPPTGSTTNPRFLGKSTEQKQVEEFLYQLCDIESSLDDLITFVDDNLSQIGNPGAADDVFPLLSSMLTARTIQNQLSGIASCASPV